MSERDDLALIMNESWYNTSTLDIADSIIESGFHRYRTITTAEELDALPVGSVAIEGDHGTPDYLIGSLSVSTMPGVFHRFPDGWYVVAGYGSREVPLPAILVWEPWS